MNDYCQVKPNAPGDPSEPKPLYSHEQQAEFESLAKPLIKWLNDNVHPHATILIITTSAELAEGSFAFSTMEFVED